MKTDDDFELILAFLHAPAVEPGEDSAERTAEWLRDRGLLDDDEAVTPDDVRRLVRLRAALTSLVAETAGVDPDPRTRPFINEAGRVAGLHVAMRDDGGVALVAAGMGVDRAIGEVLAAFYRLDIRGELGRLKACKACGWAFHDRSKNRSRVWCEMATCGSQEKSRAYRRRKAEAPAPP